MMSVGVKVVLMSYDGYFSIGSTSEPVAITLNQRLALHDTMYLYSTEPGKDGESYNLAT